MAQYSDPNGTPFTTGSSINPAAILTVVAGVVAAGFAMYFYMQAPNLKTDTETVTTRTLQADQQLQNLKPVSDKLNAYKDLATGLHFLFDNQKRWEVTLGSIQGRLYKHMRVTDLQLVDDGTVTITGSTPSFDDYAKVYAAFTDPATATTMGTIQVLSVTPPAKDAPVKEVKFSFKAKLTAAALKPVANQ